MTPKDLSDVARAGGNPFAPEHLKAIRVSGAATARATGAGAQPDDLRGLSRSYASACRVLRSTHRAAVLGPGELEFDEMGLTPTIAREPITPEMLSRAREQCELTLSASNNAPIQFSIENLQAALLQVAHEKPFHPVRECLRARRWDGVPRLADLVAAVGADHTALNASMLRKFMISAAARALRPGCKVDTTLILVGAQGAGKSRFFRALAGPWFSDTPMTIGDKDSLLVLHSAWIHEWSELESVQRAARNATVKAFLSSSEDLIRAPYDRATRRYLRSCVIVGTTNDEAFLTDPTGGRRYWVVPVKRRIDVAWVEAQRDRLWSEAVAAFDAGEPWHLSPAEERSLRRVQRRHEVADPWEPIVLSFAEANPSGVTTRGALEHLGVPAKEWDRRHATRIGSILTRAGFRKRRATLSTGEREWTYYRAARTGGGDAVVNLEVGRG